MVSRNQLLVGIAILVIVIAVILLSPQASAAPNVKFETFAINGDNGKRDVTVREGEAVTLTINVRNYEEKSFANILVKIETGEPTSDNFLRISEKEVRLRPLDGINQNTGDRAIVLTAIALDSASKSYDMQAMLVVDGRLTQEIPFKVTILR